MRLSDSPRYLMIRKTGMMVVWTGTIMVARMIPNSALAPRKRTMAKS